MNIKNAVASLVAGKKNAPAAAQASATAQPKNPADWPTELLLAWAMPTKNTRILIAYRPNTDPSNPNNLVTVNVRSNHNFMLNMRLTVSKVSEGVYDLVGPLPRWKGRW